MAVLLVLGACGSEDSAGDGAGMPVVVTTTTIWADVVANVACDGSAPVMSLVPAGADPHGFEPSLADRAAMDDAALIVANGLGLEEGLVDTIDASSTPVFELAEHIDVLAYASFGDEHDDEDHDDEDEHDEDHEDDHDAAEHDHGDADPHLWFDPQRVSAALPALADALIAAADLDRDAIDACVADYQRQLASADGAIEAQVAELAADRRKLVTSHDSLGYFADRYGFEVVGTVIPAPSGLAETNPAQLEELAGLIETTGVSAIFAEDQHSTDDVEALAARVGDVEVVTLYTGSLGGSGSGAETYIEFLGVNAERIVEGLR